MGTCIALTVSVDRLAIGWTCAQGQCQEDVLEHEELKDYCVFTARSAVKVPHLIPA